MVAKNQIVGLDIGGTKISSGLNDEGVIFERLENKTPFSESQEYILEAISDQIAHYLPYNFQAIGIGIPGLVDPDRGIVYNLANIPSFQKVKLKDFLEQRFNVPVVVNNDANCFTLGEYHFGPARVHRHVVGMTLGTGIGTGVIANNHLYTGFICGAGEWGGVSYLDKTFEDYCSSKFFKERYQDTAKRLAKKASENNKSAIHAFETYGTHLGTLITRILYTYAPEAIVIGGSIRKAFPLFEKTMMEAIGTFPYKAISDNLQIYVSERDDSAILGAISLVDEQEFQRSSGTPVPNSEIS
ncbi:ROK family transcriptional repressor [Lunatimonas lonarensis]|uniref:ROK family transcriptional repressor n=1 Tax=Lunatimonas lonarensis TaxID=1232681 RepID=R7ZX22_9BACT|nr:ROK family protein [Lunatimonas lonarensis]EON78549.1 ROK family transcriptional repressor [Lunatimonas lonarensis]